jgi:CRP-like cAMP-binding protein
MQNISAQAAAPPIDLSLLRAHCQPIRFEAGQLLRKKGQHYREMYLITDGCVAFDPETGEAGRLISERGCPIGEISFLRGCSATATVTAKTATDAVVIDDDALGRIDREQPAIAADLLRHLADTAEERLSYNLILTPVTGIYAKPQAVDVYLCRNREMLETAQRLRYEVYCQELGRQSPHADHDKKIIADNLDATGLVFVAIENGETIGTLRGNAPTEGPLGMLEELYGMKSSPHYPHATAVCTKFIVKKSRRNGPASLKLISALVRYGIRNQYKECYIDCIPALLPYYKAIGFKMVGKKFFHPENGPSFPMMLDLVKYGERLSTESGVRCYLTLIVKARALKWLARLERASA